jgi:predicted PurR-regulated permease PerM
MPARRPARSTLRPPARVQRPTPIWISRRTRTALVVAGVAAALFLLVKAPTVLTVALGGLALALVMSFPVGLLSYVLPRGWAILLSFLLAAGLLVLGVVVVVPILVDQLGALVDAAPDLMRRGERVVRGLLDPLARRGFLPGTPEEFMARLGGNLIGMVQNVAGGLLGRAGRLVAGTFATAVMLFGMLFIAVYLLVDERKIKAAYLRAAPQAYRRDAVELWDAFGYSLSRYVSGLALSLAIQGALSAFALYLLGVPYALLLGFWVAITALIPYVGAFIGAVPAVLLALTVSPMTALFTGIIFFGIQQLEGNVLTPKIQGDALRVHPILVFLAVIAGGELAGILGVIFALPTVAVLRVLYDFFRARLHVAGRSRVPDATPVHVIHSAAPAPPAELPPPAPGRVPGR